MPEPFSTAAGLIYGSQRMQCDRDQRKAVIMPLSEGALAPDFTLPTDGGGSLTLSSLRGRKVVLYAYPQDDTPSCTNEALSFDALLPRFEAAGAVVIGLSPDSVKRHDRFKQKHNLTLTLVADGERSAIEAYGLWVQKQMYGRSYMGVERTTVLIDPHGRILRIWRKVRVKGHAEEVLAACAAA
jgi:peroxiredoxin Q/BCP